MNGKIVMIGSMKGGVSKTVTTFNLAYSLNPQLLAMMGLQDFLKTVKKIKNRINSKLSVAGILLTMCDSRTNLCKVITEEVTETFEGQIKIFESMIPNTVRLFVLSYFRHYHINIYAYALLGQSVPTLFWYNKII